MSDPCPCGVEVKPGQPFLSWLDGEAVKAFVGGQYPEFSALVDQLIGQPMDWSEICSHQPPSPVSYVFADFLPANWGATLAKVNQDAIATLWSQHCQCIDCGPVTGCSTGGAIPLGPADGYCHDFETIGGVDVCVQNQYVMLGGVDVYVSRDSDGHCYGPFNGLTVDWIINSTFDPALNVTLESYGGGGHTGWNGATFGQNLTAWIGGGSGGAPVWPWPPAPAGIDPYPDPPACDPTTVCTAIEYLQETVERIQRVIDQMLTFAGPAQLGAVTIPGGTGTLVGTVPSLLMPTLQALLPITPTQLSTPTITPLTSSGTVALSGTALVSIEFTTVPDYFGYRGTEGVVYYSNARSPGPGWVLVAGDTGVIGYYPIVYPAGLQLLVPPTATTLLVDLTPGVEVAITTYLRVLA